MKYDDLPNPFECATPVAGVTAMLTPQDIANLVQGFTIAQAKQLLEQYGSSIAAEMLAAGMTTALQIAKRKGVRS